MPELSTYLFRPHWKRADSSPRGVLPVRASSGYQLMAEYLDGSPETWAVVWRDPRRSRSRSWCLLIWDRSRKAAVVVHETLPEEVAHRTAEAAKRAAESKLCEVLATTTPGESWKNR